MIMPSNAKEANKIKVWCKTCNETGVIPSETEFDSTCTTCNGQGYTEHEGSLEDLQLGLAVEMVRDQKGVSNETDYWSARWNCK